MSIYLKIITTCLGLLLSYSSLAQFVYYDQSETTNSELLNSYVEKGIEIRYSLLDLGFVAERFGIYEVGSKTLMTVDGRFDVYEWIDNNWINIYSGIYHGYNFNSHKFIFNNKLYSYRGYGFWRQHGEIIEFIPEKGEWQIVMGTEVLPFGIGYVQDSLFTVYDEHCYNVDLNAQLVKQTECDLRLKEDIRKGQAYLFSDYILLESVLEDGSQYPIIDKNSQQLYISNKQPFSSLRDDDIKNSLIHIQYNRMSIYFPNRKLVEYSIKDELQYYIPMQEDEQHTIKWILLAIMLITIAAFLFIRRLYSKNSSGVDEDGVLQKFSQYSDQIINSDTIDKILEIDSITVYETKKYKRASLIKEVNIQSKSKYGKDMIVRKKDPADKRFYLYQIQKF